MTDTQQQASAADAALTEAMHAEMTDADARVAGLAKPAVAPYQPSELGVIDRITRTHQRLGTPGTLAVTLALMTLDTLPVILKLTHGPTNYERILARRHQAAAVRLLAETVNPQSADSASLALALLDAGAGEPLTDDDELEQLLRARLTLDPTIAAKDLHAIARARGYTGKYSTFTRFLRTRELRVIPAQPRDNGDTSND